MTKTKKNRKMKGGLLGFNETSNNTWLTTISQNATDMWNNVSQNVKDIWERSKQSLQSNQTYQSSFQSNNNSYFNSGGKKTKKNQKSKKMRGGYKPNISYTSIASNSATASQPTANPQVWLTGGRSKKYKNHKKSMNVRKNKN